MPPDATPSSDRADAASQLSGGLRAVRETPFAVWLIMVVAVVEFTYGAQTVQLVIFAKHSLNLGDDGYGILLTAAGVGGLMSAFLNGRLSTSQRVTLIVILTAALACGTQLAYAGATSLTIALAVAVIGTAGAVSCEVVGETVLARIAPRELLGRLVGIFDAACAAAVIVGAILAPVLINSASLRDSLLVLGGIALLITVVCGVGIRGLDALSAHRADALASRVKVLEGLPVTVGVQRIALEQLAAAGQFLPDLPPGVDVIVQGMPAHSFYAVVTGRVLVHRDGKAVVHLGPGDSFGERGLLDRAPRNATVTTELETTLLRVEGQALLSALDTAPALRTALDVSSTAPGVQVPAGEPSLVDDPRWVEA